MVNLMKNIKNPPDIWINPPVTCTFNKIWSRSPRKTPRNTPLRKRKRKREREREREQEQEETEKEKRKGHGQGQRKGKFSLKFAKIC
jgi:hypothetical protein